VHFISLQFSKAFQVLHFLTFLIIDSNNFSYFTKLYLHPRFSIQCHSTIQLTVLNCKMYRVTQKEDAKLALQLHFFLNVEFTHKFYQKLYLTPLLSPCWHKIVSRLNYLKSLKLVTSKDRQSATFPRLIYIYSFTLIAALKVSFVAQTQDLVSNLIGQENLYHCLQVLEVRNIKFFRIFVLQFLWLYCASAQFHSTVFKILQDIILHNYLGSAFWTQAWNLWEPSIDLHRSYYIQLLLRYCRLFSQKRALWCSIPIEMLKLELISSIFNWLQANSHSS
jgi:hypothetical protein